MGGTLHELSCPENCVMSTDDLLRIGKRLRSLFKPQLTAAIVMIVQLYSVQDRFRPYVGQTRIRLYTLFMAARPKIPYLIKTIPCRPYKGVPLTVVETTPSYFFPV